MSLVSLDITAEERVGGTLAAAKVKTAVEALERDGVVALHNAIELEHVDALAAKMLADADAFDAGEHGPIQNSWQGLLPPPRHPFLFRDIAFNEQCIAVLRALMGDDIVLTGYGANTAFSVPEPTIQHAHIDHGEPQPPGPCQMVAVQAILLDTDEENGATEYWPGSHLDAGQSVLSDRMVPEELLASWPRGSGRFACPRGSLLLRDMKMWHRGMPNTTAVHRPMPTLIVKTERMIADTLLSGGVQPGFAADAESRDFWQHPRLKAAAWLFPGEVDYLGSQTAHSRPAERDDADKAEQLFVSAGASRL